jgi:transcriptional regulator with XRE-family HTH domain
MNPTPDDKARLASTLKNLRVDAGLSTTRLAGVLGWSQSKVSKTETGRTMPAPDDVAAWCRQVNAPAGVREELVEIAAAAAAQATEWRRELAPGRRRKQDDIRRMEHKASVIRVFAPDVVVGLAQTRAYVEKMFRLGRKIGPVDEPAEDVINARLARAEVLDRTDKVFVLLMGEFALRRTLIPAEEMRAQIQWLIELSHRPNIDVEVIPFAAEEKVHQYNGFAILGDPDVDDEAIVLAETLTRGLSIRSSEEIREYIEHFDALRVAAIRGDELREFLQEVIDGLPR